MTKTMTKDPHKCFTKHIWNIVHNNYIAILWIISFYELHCSTSCFSVNGHEFLLFISSITRQETFVSTKGDKDNYSCQSWEYKSKMKLVPCVDKLLACLNRVSLFCVHKLLAFVCLNKPRAYCVFTNCSPVFVLLFFWCLS
jgi:hypothetical protein